MSLTSKARVEKYLLTTIDGTFDAQVTEWIAGVEKYIDKETDRKMVADDSPADYSYDGTGRKDMLIEDFFSIVSVKMKSDKDDVAPEDITTDCYFYPANKTPKYQLKSDNTYFTRGNQNIIVNGRRGYFASDDVDEDLIFAATVLVAGIINNSNISTGEIKSESIGRYTVTYSTDQQKVDFESAMSIIKNYRRIR